MAVARVVGAAGGRTSRPPMPRWTPDNLGLTYEPNGLILQGVDRLDGKVAAIVGGNGRTGLATVARFVAGAEVSITGRRQEELDQTVLTI